MQISGYISKLNINKEAAVREGRITRGINEMFLIND